MIRRAAVLLALLVWGEGAVARAQAVPVIHLVDPGPTLDAGPRVLADALAGPYVAIAPGRSPYVVPPSALIRAALIVLGRDVAVEGTVQSDVIVIGGDLYMHPGGRVAGRAIAIGGGVYESSLASIGGGTRVFRDFTYDIQPARDGFDLRYRSLAHSRTSPAAWAAASGIALPTYDRSDGVSLSAGPSLGPVAGLVLEPRLTYRSQLGRLDPALTLTDSLGRGSSARLMLERTTLSNEAWIWPDVINSAEFLVAGDDARNYYRANRVELSLAHRWEASAATAEPWVAIAGERGSSVRPDSTAIGGPWTLLERRGRDDVLRPNPGIDAGTIVSLLAGARVSWSAQGVTSRLDVAAEAGRIVHGGEAAPFPDETFGQVTADGAVDFPTFGVQRFRLDGHAVLSTNGRTPRQRWAYLGGPGTIPTLDMLALGGDRLVYVDGRYDVPLAGVSLPLVGSPTLTLRDILGGASVGRFPTLHQAAGGRLSLGVAYGEWLVDPVRRVSNVTFGLSAAR